MSRLTTGSFIIRMFNAFTGTSFKEKWYENQVAKKDRIEQLRCEKLDTDKDIVATNRAMLELQKITHDEITFTKEPKISDFYKPSTEMKELTHVVSGLGGFGLGF